MAMPYTAVLENWCDHINVQQWLELLPLHSCPADVTLNQTCNELGLGQDGMAGWE